MERDKDELVSRLETIDELCTEALEDGRPMLTYQYDLLNQIKNIASYTDFKLDPISSIKTKPLDHVIISCGSAIGPKKQIAIAIVTQYKDEPIISYYEKIRKSKTLIEGDYDAIYRALTQLFNLKNNPGCLVEVRTNNKMVVDQLYSKIECDSDRLSDKKENILELVKTLPVPVKVVWKPYNSTQALRRAINLAQNLI